MLQRMERHESTKQKSEFIHLDSFILLEQELDCLTERAQTEKQYTILNCC